MIDFIIKLLGGATKDEIGVLTRIIAFQNKNMFRTGDLVYIRDGRFNPLFQYYLLESYNNKSHWYVSVKKDDNTRRELLNGVGIESISFDAIQCCPCCEKPL